MAYSMDLRIRVVQAHINENLTIYELARLFQLAVGTVETWITRHATLGTPIRMPRGGGRIRRIGPIGEVVLLGILERNPDATLQELAVEYAWITHMPMSASVISHSLKRLNITRKKRPFFPMNAIRFGCRLYERRLPMKFRELLQAS